MEYVLINVISLIAFNVQTLLIVQNVTILIIISLYFKINHVFVLMVSIVIKIFVNSVLMAVKLVMAKV